VRGGSRKMVDYLYSTEKRDRKCRSLHDPMACSLDCEVVEQCLGVLPLRMDILSSFVAVPHSFCGSVQGKV
jgi:hypothetical protein